MYDKIINLPNELKWNIFEFIPKLELITCSRIYFKLYFRYKYKIFENKYDKIVPLYVTPITLNRIQYDTYIRRIIRNDDYFIFSSVLYICYWKWINFKKWRYNNIIFNNYVEYIHYLCNLYCSGHCKNILKKFIKKIN